MCTTATLCIQMSDHSTHTCTFVTLLCATAPIQLNETKVFRNKKLAKAPGEKF